VAHFEWPDMRNLSAWNDIVAQNTARAMLGPARQPK